MLLEYWKFPSTFKIPSVIGILLLFVITGMLLLHWKVVLPLDVVISLECFPPTGIETEIHWKPYYNFFQMNKNFKRTVQLSESPSSFILLTSPNNTSNHLPLINRRSPPQNLFKLKIPSSIKKVLFIVESIINLSKQARNMRNVHD
jgi:hypothetical protein